MHEFHILIQCNLSTSAGHKCGMLGVINVYFIANTYLRTPASLVVEISLYVFCIASNCLSSAVFMSFIGFSSLWFVFRHCVPLSISETFLVQRPSVAADGGSLGNAILKGEVPVQEASGCLEHTSVPPHTYPNRTCAFKHNDAVWLLQYDCNVYRTPLSGNITLLF